MTRRAPVVLCTLNAKTLTPTSVKSPQADEANPQLDQPAEGVADPASPRHVACRRYRGTPTKTLARQAGDS